MAASGTDAPTLLEALIRGVFAPTQTKWQANHEVQLQKRQLVLCREDEVASLNWMLGRIQICPESDQIVRTAVMKTATGVFKRPAAKLAILPLDTQLRVEKETE